VGSRHQEGEDHARVTPTARLYRQLGMNADFLHAG